MGAVVYKPPPFEEMGFLSDLTGWNPDASLLGNLAGLAANMFPAYTAYRLFTGDNPVVDSVSDVWSSNIPSTMDGVTSTIDNLREEGLGDYVGNLFQTDADAALDQAEVNEDLARRAWERSEESADRAMRRARELRQTYAADLMKGYQDAGLNPVLAASGGFGGVSSSAPQGTSTAATSSKADGLNAANLLQAIASILSGAGSLVSGLNPLKSLTTIDSNGALSRTAYSYGRR